MQFSVVGLHGVGLHGSGTGHGLSRLLASMKPDEQEPLALAPVQYERVGSAELKHQAQLSVLVA